MTFRTWVALAASLLTGACASGVQLRTPQANFSRAQAVLASVGTAQGLSVMYVAAGYPASGYQRSRVAIEVFMPGEQADAHAHTTPLVYSLEISDVSGQVTFWVAEAEHAAPLCRALLAANVPFEIAEGRERAPECAAPP